MAKLKSIGTIKSIGTLDPHRPVKPPPPTKSAGRPPIVDHRTLFPQGPAFLKLGVTRAHPGGPGEKPIDFTGPQTEWVWYWASKRVLEPKADARRGPYVGAADGSWGYQVPELAGEVRQVGNSISDFQYNLPTGIIIVRIEGFYWHTAAPPAQQARDAYLTTHAQNEQTRVERVEDTEFMQDSTGETACRVLAEILAGRSFIGAISGGVAVPPRYANFSA